VHTKCPDAPLSSPPSHGCPVLGAKVKCSDGQGSCTSHKTVVTTQTTPDGHWVTALAGNTYAGMLHQASCGVHAATAGRSLLEMLRVGMWRLWFSGFENHNCGSCPFLLLISGEPWAWPCQSILLEGIICPASSGVTAHHCCEVAIIYLQVSGLDKRPT
jgi:hypothetical protein